MAVDGPGYADGLSDGTLDGDSIYSPPSIVSYHSSQSSQSGSRSNYATGWTYFGPQERPSSYHSHSSSYSGSGTLKPGPGNYGSLKTAGHKRRTPPAVAPRPHHGSLKRLDRLPPPYARPSSAGHDDQPEPPLVKARSTTFNGDVFTSKLTLIPCEPSQKRACSQNFGAQHFGKTLNFPNYQNPWTSPKRNNHNNNNNSNTNTNITNGNNNNLNGQRTNSGSHLNNGQSRANFGINGDNTNRSTHARQVFDDHVYEDPELCMSPAKLPPESGMLAKNQNKVVLRPLAFKPVVMQPKPEAPSIPDEGYHSTEFRHQRLSSSDYHQENGYGRIQKPVDSRPGSFNSSNHSRMSSGHTETFMQTPSPSDSGVSELEAILREKDAEITHLRETMEGNERAIFQVFEDKKRSWHSQMDQLVQDYEEKLKCAQQKAFKSEQSLLMQIVKLQQDKKALTTESENFKAKVNETDTINVQLDRDLSQSKSRLEEVNWSLQQKTGELSLVKSQLRDAKEDSQHRCGEMTMLRSQLTECKADLENKRVELEKMRATFNEGKRQLQRSCQELDRLGLEKGTVNTSFELGPGDRIANCGDSDNEDSNNVYQREELKRLRKELDKIKSEKRELQEEFDNEKSQWLDEKNRVICYQKQLQLNYVQMLRKNKVLEEEVEQLMLDLERNDLKVPDSNC